MPTYSHCNGNIGVKKNRKKKKDFLSNTISKFIRERLEDPYLNRNVNLILQNLSSKEDIGKIIDRVYEDGFSDGFNNAKGKV